MIDKNFYLENLSAFDILIEDEDRNQAQVVIFRVYSILQRDKIWLRDVATEEEISEDDEAFLQEIEEELTELDAKYHFRFDEFYQLVQQEVKKMQATSHVNLVEADLEADLADPAELEQEDFFYDEDEQDLDEFGHLSDEDLEIVTDCILEAAKTRFDYPALVQEFLGDEEWIDTEFLLPLIAAKAFGETPEEIVEKMLPQFIEVGFYLDTEDLIELVEENAKVLGAEILAFKIASDSLQQGAQPSEIVQQVSQLLHT